MQLSVYEQDILLLLNDNTKLTQREIANECKCSLGIVNQSIKNLREKKIIDEKNNIINDIQKIIIANSPKRAIILAAGFGMRMVPINTEFSKAFLEVKGEKLIERHIRHLHEVGINDIYVVVGFMKEQFEYLIDEFGVELIINSDFSTKNNLFSLQKAISHIENCYIIPCDIWCSFNPFRKHEIHSWYMVSNEITQNSEVRLNRKQELVAIDEQDGNKMIGISYVTTDIQNMLIENIEDLCKQKRSEDYFWERALFLDKSNYILGRVVDKNVVHEINTYEQLRDLDADSSYLKSDILETIANVFNVNREDIINISVLKKGMTNRSFIFTCKGKKYIMRVPGEGTEQLINRKQEGDVYKAISGRGICDDPVYFDEITGYKITKYLDSVRSCDPNSESDLYICMKKLKEFHNMKLKVKHSFDIFEQIDFYESLWGNRTSIYKDYIVTKNNVMNLKNFVMKYSKEKVLTHIDAVPDNFLFFRNSGNEEVQLTDWEYAGMQDPDVDIAMFCIYSFYNRSQTDNLISIYYENKVDKIIQAKIYAYMSICGLLWSNWCEYKSNLGVEFGEYSIRQYRYAKEFYRYAIELIERFEDENEK